MAETPEEIGARDAGEREAEAEHHWEGAGRPPLEPEAAGPRSRAAILVLGVLAGAVIGAAAALLITRRG
ncbi:MAG: hypothetical protein HY561_09605 [Gemmatimonadetes bacterium]|nr:hypothetical protein [Gemmatimonadota bacterium]